MLNYNCDLGSNGGVHYDLDLEEPRETENLHLYATKISQILRFVSQVAAYELVIT